MSQAKATCPKCQRPLPEGKLGGNCPVCLMDAILGGPEEEFMEEDLLSIEEGSMGDYEILEEIGRGGSSVVYRARQKSLNRIVALKTLKVAAQNFEEGLERLKVEAKAVARLDHPNIVNLYEVGNIHGLHFLTLQYFQEGNLH